MNDETMILNLRRQEVFLDDLNRRIYKVHQTIGLLDSQMRMLKTKWQDSQFEEFCKRVERTKAILEEFVEESKKQAKEIAKAHELATQYRNVQ